MNKPNELDDYLREVIKNNDKCNKCVLKHENNTCFFAYPCIKNNWCHYTKGSTIKTFEEVQKEMYHELQDCLMPTEKFLDDWERGAISSYDGVGDIHNGYVFITNGFKEDIFDFILEEAPNMTKEEFIKKYPYVAWYNK